MTAIRSVGAAEGKFVQISNDLIRNEELSVLARFIVCYVLSLPPDHHFTAAGLETKLPGYGTRSIRAALRELKTHGYMKVSRKSHDGTWEWEQVISDAPLTSENHESLQVVASERFAPDAYASDANRSDKELNTEQPKDEDQKMAPAAPVSRRGAASSAAAQRTTKQSIADIRTAIANVSSQGEADNLTDGEVVGLFYTYGNPRKRVRDLVAYMSKILEDAHCDVDALLAGSEAVCIPCWSYESACKCSQAGAA